MSHFGSYDTTNVSYGNIPVAVLQTALTTITGVSSLSATALTVPLSQDDKVHLIYGGYGEQFTVSGSVAAGSGSTSIPIVTQTPSYAFPVGTEIISVGPVGQLPLGANQQVTIGPFQTDVAQQLTGSLWTDQSGVLYIQQSFDAYDPNLGQFTLSSQISPIGGAISSVSVSPLPEPIYNGSQIVVNYGRGGAPQNTFTQSFTVSGTAQAGATTLLLTSQTPNYTFPAGSNVNVMNFDISSTTTVTVSSGGTGQGTGFTATILAPWIQLVYVNGSTAQGVMRLSARTFFQGR